MRKFFLAITIVATCAASSYHGYKVGQGSPRPLDKQEIDFVQWQTCIDLSDGSDSGCLECDAMYNPLGVDYRKYIDTLQVETWEQLTITVE